MGKGSAEDKRSNAYSLLCTFYSCICNTQKRPVNLTFKFTGRFEHGGLLTVLQQVVFQQGLAFDHGIELFHRGEQGFHVFHRHGIRAI